MNLASSTTPPSVASGADTAPREQADRTLALDEHLEHARAACLAGLAAPDVAAVGHALAQLGVSEAQSVTLVHSLGERMEGQRPVEALKARVAELGVVSDPTAAVERCLLLRAALRVIDDVPQLPVGDRVKREFFDEFKFWAAPPRHSIPDFLTGQWNFSGMCVVAALRRFPAGQTHFKVSRIPKSLLAKVPPRDLPRVLAFVARRMRGLGPVFYLHMSWRRKSRITLLEGEQLRAYHAMARSLERQPHVRGIAGASWFHAPVTFEVSPQLAWINRVFLEEGGLVTLAGPAHPAGGVLRGGGERRRLLEEGKFKPMTGLVMWPRDAVLDWAARHPEYAAL